MLLKKKSTEGRRKGRKEKRKEVRTGREEGRKEGRQPTASLVSPQREDSAQAGGP